MTVVIGYDGEPSGEDALALGLRYAGRVRARAVVAVVYPEPAPIGAGRVDAEWVADRRAQATEFLRRAESLVGDGADVEFRAVASSSAAHGLSDLVEQVDGSLVVVGSRTGGAADGPRTAPGSTANRLLHGATAPVAVAPRGMRERDWADPVTIGVAYVRTAESAAALRFAAGFALAAGARLRVYTVLAGEAPVLPWLIGADAEHAFSATAREAFRVAVDEALAELPSGLDVTGEVLIGDVVAALAELPDVDLLVCGSRGYGPVRSVLLGGVSSRLVRRSRNPLVVVPRG